MAFVIQKFTLLKICSWFFFLYLFFFLFYIFFICFSLAFGVINLRLSLPHLAKTHVYTKNCLYHLSYVIYLFPPPSSLSILCILFPDTFQSIIFRVVQCMRWKLLHINVCVLSECVSVLWVFSFFLFSFIAKIINTTSRTVTVI